MESIFPVDARRLALCVIDTQVKLMAGIHNPERVTKATILLLKAAKEFNLPVFITTQYEKGIGPIINEIAEVAFKELGLNPIDKLEFDSFSNKEALAWLNGLSASVDTLILCGVETHICIHQTAFSAKRRGYNVIVCEDAVSSRKKRLHKASIKNFIYNGIQVYPAETIAFELLRQAGIPEFKALLKYIK